MISLEVWRARIGTFSFPHSKQRFKAPAIAVSASALRVAMWLTCILAIGIQCDKPGSACPSLQQWQWISSILVTSPVNITTCADGPHTQPANQWNVNNLPQLQASHTSAIIGIRLLTCGDVELNPGPPPGSSKPGGQRDRVQTRLRSSQGNLYLGKDTADDTLLHRLDALEGKVEVLEQENIFLQRKLDALENQSRRNNLVEI